MNNNSDNVSINSSFSATPITKSTFTCMFRKVLAVICLFFVAGLCCAQSLSTILGQELFDAIKNRATVKEVESLIKAGADVNFTVEGFSVLVAAIIVDESPEIIKALIKGGANVNVCWKDDFNKISQAENFAKQPLSVDELWQILENLAAQEYQLQITPLACAILFKSNPETIKALVNAGAFVNAKMAGGVTALMAACMKNKVETALFGDISSYELYDREEKWAEANFDPVAYLISKGADVNAKSDDGINVLGHTIKDGLDIATLKTLIKAGADVNALCYKDKNYTLDPLFSLIILPYKLDGFKIEEKNLTEGFRLFVNAGANVNNLINGEDSILMYACSYGVDTEIIKILIRAGASVNIKNTKGETALMWALQRKYVDIDSIETLLLVNADVNAKDNNGKSVLMYAVDNKSPDLDVIAILLKNGADVRATDNKGETALSYAKRNNDSYLYDALLQYILNN